MHAGFSVLKLFLLSPFGGNPRFRWIRSGWEQGYQAGPAGGRPHTYPGCQAGAGLRCAEYNSYTRCVITARPELPRETNEALSARRIYRMDAAYVTIQRKREYHSLLPDFSAATAAAAAASAAATTELPQLLLLGAATVAPAAGAAAAGAALFTSVFV